MTRARPPVVLSLVLLALSSTVSPVLAQSTQPTLSLALHDDLREQEAQWIGQLARHLDNLTREENLTRSDVQRLMDGFNRTAAAHQKHQWRAVTSGLIIMHQEATFMVVSKHASRVEQGHRVFMNASDASFQDAVRESQALRRDIAAATPNMTTTRGLETLYLAAQLTAQGNEMLRQYPLHRDIVESGGNKTLASFLRALIHGPTGAVWNFHYARDLVDLAAEVDSLGGGSPVDMERLPGAFRSMETEIRGLRSVPTDSDYRSAMNATASRGEWLLATAVGEALLDTNFFTTLRMAQQAGATTTEKVTSVLVEDASDLSDAVALTDAGYLAVGMKDAHVGALVAVHDPEPAFDSVAAATAQLRAARGATEVLLAVATPTPADNGTDGVETAGAGAGFPVGAAAGGLVVGVALGAAVAVAAARREEDA